MILPVSWRPAEFSTGSRARCPEGGDPETMDLKGVGMSKKIIVLLVVATVFLAVAPDLSADGHRKGFVFGLGIGAGNSGYTTTWYRYSYWPIWTETEVTARQSSWALATDFKIGFGLSDHVILAYTNKVMWMSFVEPVGQESQAAISGATMLGLSYFLKSGTPSLFFSGAVGAAVWSRFPQANNEDERWLGLGLSLGVGFEFSRHWMIELSALKGYGGKGQTGAGANPLGIMFTLNFLGY